MDRAKTMGARKVWIVLIPFPLLRVTVVILAVVTKPHIQNVGSLNDQFFYVRSI